MSRGLRVYGAVAFGVAAVSTGVLLRGRERPGAAPPSGGEETVPCAAGLAPVRGGACFAAPSGARRPGERVPLIVYLHGRFNDAGEGEELARQTRLARLATARGFAVLTFRGQRGQCTDKTLADYWCWPSNETNAEDGPRFVSAFGGGLGAASEQIPIGRTALLGFSNGGYFATLIATRGLMPVDAVVVAHAGPVEPTEARGPKPPMLLITADDDPSNDEVLRLDAELTRAAWPHAIVAREGGHDLPEWDIDMALRFVTRTATEKWPLVPPLSTRAPRRTTAEAGASDAGGGMVSASTGEPLPEASASGRPESDRAGPSAEPAAEDGPP